MTFLPKWFTDMNIIVRRPTISGNQLELVDSVTYLGHLITSDLSDGSDIKIQQRKLCTRANIIIRKFSKCSEACKIALFRSYVTPIYCASLWHSFYAYELNSLKISYNKAFRRLFLMPRECSVSHNMVQRRLASFEELMRKTNSSLFYRVRTSSNPLVKNLVSDFALINSAYGLRWFRDIF